MPDNAKAQLPEGLQQEARLNLRQVKELTGAGKTWIYAQIAAGRFPEPERQGPRFARWRAGDVIEAMNARRVAEAS